MFEGRAEMGPATTGKRFFQELDGFCAENQLESGPEGAERDQKGCQKKKPEVANVL